MPNYKIQLDAFFISHRHNYFGHKDKTPSSHETFMPDTIDCVTQKGIVGDRFYDLKKNYDGQVTFVNSEVVDLIQEQHDKSKVKAELFRRNIMISGVNVIELIGKQFEIDGVVFEGVKHCAPCHWMDVSMGKGVMKLMKGRGGLRVRVLKGGRLKLGETQLLCNDSLAFEMTQALSRPKLP